MEKTMLDVEELIEAVENIDWHSVNKMGVLHEGAPNEEKAFMRYADVAAAIEPVQKKTAIFIPCKIGDLVWAIRSYKGVLHPQQGCVSEMYFTQDMHLQIVVKHVARGQWGEKVFATYAEAAEAIVFMETKAKKLSVW